MLVLSRKVNESIIIDGGIKITVLAVLSGGRVKIGLQVPSQIPIYREEIMPAPAEEEAVVETKREPVPAWLSDADDLEQDFQPVTELVPVRSAVAVSGVIVLSRPRCCSV